MVILVYGGSGSGKSAFAENLALDLKTPDSTLYYVATMKYNQNDTEALLKIERHKSLRNGKGFTTIEETKNLEAAAKRILKDCKMKVPLKNENSDCHATVLLECASNLCANLMFLEGGKVQKKEQVLEDFFSGIKNLSSACQNLVIVSNNIFEDGILYEEATKNYMDTLGKINCELAKMSDSVYEVVCGIPIKIK